MWSKPRTRAAVDCGKTDRGDVREEMWWEMPLEEKRAAMETRRRGWSHHHSLSLCSCASLEFRLPALQSGKCLQTHSPGEHQAHTVYFFLMNHSPALPIVQCPETVVSYILCSFLSAYREGVCPITVTPSQQEAEVNQYEIWPYIKI